MLAEARHETTETRLLAALPLVRSTAVSDECENTGWEVEQNESIQKQTVVHGGRSLLAASEKWENIYCEIKNVHGCLRCGLLYYPAPRSTAGTSSLCAT